LQGYLSPPLATLCQLLRSTMANSLLSSNFLVNSLLCIENSVQNDEFLLALVV
jgi:hypothetical protein